MRKLIIIIMSVLMVAILPVQIMAEELSEGDRLLIAQNDQWAEEQEQVGRTIGACYREWTRYLGDDFDAINLSHMYRIYYMKSKDIVDAYNKNGSFGANILDDYYWIVPCYDTGGEVQVVRNDKAEYGWSVRRGTNYLKRMHFSFLEIDFSISGIYDNIMVQYPDADVDSIRMVYYAADDMHIVYFTCQGVEYTVPYFADKEINDITNARIYTAEELIFLFNDMESQESSVATIQNDDKDFENIYTNYIAIGSVLVIVVAIVAVIIAKRNNRNNEE